MACGARAKVISGVLESVQGPVRDIVTDLEFFDVMLPAYCTLKLDVKSGYTAIAYVLDGQAYFDDCREAGGDEATAGQWSESAPSGPCEPGNVALYGHQGDRVVVTSLSAPARFLYLSGRPLHEPVAWRGPIVMNTDEELRLAFRELQNGTFIR